MNLAHLIALDPTSPQADYFVRACGAKRFVWNLAHEEWERQFAAASAAAKAARESLPAKTKKSVVKRAIKKAVEAIGGWPSAAWLKADFNSWKYEVYPWLKEIHRDAHSQPFADLQDAYSRFRAKTAEKPKFKKKGKAKDSFYVANDKFELDGSKIRLPNVGEVRMAESLRFTGKIMSATVSRRADRWFVSISVETDDPRPTKLKKNGQPRRSAQPLPATKRCSVSGLDFGILHAVVTSAGVVYDAPKPLKEALKKLARLQRGQARRLEAQKAGGRKERSQAWRDANKQIARLHARIANIRKDFIHKMTTDLCRENQALVIEDLNVKGMMQNHCLARALSDVGLGEIRRQLTYKAEIYGTELVVASRWFASTKKCSRCGVVGPKLPLSQRTFKCASCGFECDRDLNASLNLEHELTYPRLEGNQRLRTERKGSLSAHDGEQPSLEEAGTKRALVRNG